MPGYCDFICKICMWIWRMEKISSLDKITNEETLRSVNEDRQILNSIWQRKHRWIGHALRNDGLLHEVIEGRMRGKVNQQEGGEEFKCYMIWQMMVDLLHWNGQLRTDRHGNTYVFVCKVINKMSKTCCRKLPVLMMRLGVLETQVLVLRHLETPLKLWPYGVIEIQIIIIIIQLLLLLLLQSLNLVCREYNQIHNYTQTVARLFSWVLS